MADFYEYLASFDDGKKLLKEFGFRDIMPGFHDLVGGIKGAYSAMTTDPLDKIKSEIKELEGKLNNPSLSAADRQAINDKLWQLMMDRAKWEREEAGEKRLDQQMGYSSNTPHATFDPNARFGT